MTTLVSRNRTAFAEAFAESMAPRILVVGEHGSRTVHAQPVAAEQHSTPTRFVLTWRAGGGADIKEDTLAGIRGAAKSGLRTLPATQHARLEEALVEIQALLDYAREEAHRAAGIASSSRFVDRGSLPLFDEAA